MATGQLPFHGADMIATLMAVATEEPRPPRGLSPALPRELSDLILKLLAKDPARRPQSARAVVEAIQALESKQPAPARGHVKLLAIVCGVLLLAGGAGILVAGKVFQKTEHPVVPEAPPAKGELTFASTRSAVRIQIAREGQQVGTLESKTGFHQALEPGEYELSLADGPPGLLLSAERLTLSPGGKETLRLLNAPLSHQALVHRPAPLPGVDKWTIETTQPRGPVCAVAYHPKGRWLATAGFDGVLRLWDPASGKLIRALVGHHSAIIAVAWSPDGRYLASAGAKNVPTYDRRLYPAGISFPAEVIDPTIRLWDAESGRTLAVLTGHTDTPRALAFSPDGKTLASAGQDRTLRFWNVAEGKLEKTVVGHQHWFHQVAWSPNGKLLATDFQGDIQIRDALTGAVVRTLHGHESWIFGLAWAPKGGMLASCSQDGTVRLWRGGAGNSIHTLKNNKVAVRALAWHPEGQRLAGINDRVNLLRVWDAETGKSVVSQKVGEVLSVAWSPDGRTLATGGWNGVIAQWSAETG
jgi:WD40 repeat protein